MISLNDVGASWRSLESTSFWQEVRAEEGDMLRAPLVDARKRLGIRLTSDRWNTWMGPRTVIGKADEGWGITAKPGLLLRGVHAWNRMVGQRSDGGVWTFRGWYYGWRDAYLVAAPDAAYVRAVLDGGIAVNPNESATVVRIDIVANDVRPAHSLQIEPTDSFPIEGTVEAAFTSMPAESPVGAVAARTAVLSISGARLTEIGSYAASFLPSWRNLDELRDELNGASTLGWPSGSAPGMAAAYSVLVVHDIDTAPFLVVPSVYTRVAWKGPVSDVASLPVGAVPYAWGEREGWSALRKGMQMMSWVAWDSAAFHAANSAAAMEKYIDSSMEEPASDFDVRVSLDWDRATGYAERIILAAVEAELLPEINRRDAELRYGKIMPWFRHLGRLEYTGKTVDGKLQFHGLVSGAAMNDEPNE
jgi:hypothetical protein